MIDDTGMFSHEKFKCFVRFMIQAAKNKRCVPYVEIENIFGLSHKQAGIYAGHLGDYCLKRGISMLNGLLISSTDCTPSEGFDYYQNQYGKSWGEVVAACWKEYHVTSNRNSQSQDFSGRDADVEDFLKN